MMLCAGLREVILASWVAAFCWCTAGNSVVTVSEQNRAGLSGASVGAHVKKTWLSLHSCECVGVCSRVAAHSGTSAAVTSLSC